MHLNNGAMLKFGIQFNPTLLLLVGYFGIHFVIFDDLKEAGHNLAQDNFF